MSRESTELWDMEFSDVDTAGLLDIQEGTLYKAQILAVSRGSRGNPGELAGMIRYDNSNVLGSIQENCKTEYMDRWICLMHRSLVW